MEEDLPVSNSTLLATKGVFDEVALRAQDCSALVSAVVQKLKGDEVASLDGLSFLTLKNHLQLQYLLSLSGLILTKTEGESIQNRSFLDQLIELRVVLEKIRPFDHKLKYQIEKLLKSGARAKQNGALDEEDRDPFSHKAHLDDLNEGEEDDQFDEGETTPKAKTGVYVPPKVAATEYLDEETPEKRVEKARKKTVSHLLIREMQEELLDTPTEIFHGRGGGGGSSGSGQASRTARDKQSYEEKYMTRLPETKKDKHSARSLTTLGVLGDEITNFRPPRAGGSGGGGKKRKMKKGKGGKKKKIRRK